MEKSIFSKIYMWVFIGLLITFASGYYLQTSLSLLSLLFTNSSYLILYIAQIAIAIILPVRLHKMSKTTATILYLVYTLLTGLTFSSIFVIFNIWDIVFVFLVTALVFLIFALIGRFTKIDLTKIGTFLLMAIIGIIILEIINIFVMSSGLDLFLCIVGLIVFLGYIAYDVQKIKRMSDYGMDQDKLAIYGAFELYLDFINVFLRLLQLFGRRRD